MCLAIYKKAGAVIPSEGIITSSKSNNDGYGVAVALGDRLHLVRSMKLDGVLKTLERFKEFPAIVHLRMATHGEKTEKNCHPFLVDDNTAFIHNGVLTIPTPQKEYSDTWHFANLIVKPHQRETAGEWLWTSHASLNLHLLAGYSNKFCFLRADGKHLIVNESAGHWSECGGIWYSNSSYKSTPAYSYGGSSYYQSSLGFALPSHYARATESCPVVVADSVPSDEEEELLELLGQFLEEKINADAWCEFLDTYGNRKAFKKWARENPAVSDAFQRWMCDPNEKGHYSLAEAYKVARRLYVRHWEEVELEKFGEASLGVPDYTPRSALENQFGDCDV
jgi:hypothetical protein